MLASITKVGRFFKALDPPYFRIYKNGSLSSGAPIIFYLVHRHFRCLQCHCGLEPKAKVTRLPPDSYGSSLLWHCNTKLEDIVYDSKAI